MSDLPSFFRKMYAANPKRSKNLPWSRKTVDGIVEVRDSKGSLKALVGRKTFKAIKRAFGK